MGAGLPKDSTAVLGLVSTKSGRVEDASEIRRRLDDAAKVKPIEELALSTQCGFGTVAAMAQVDSAASTRRALSGFLGSCGLIADLRRVSSWLTIARCAMLAAEVIARPLHAVVGRRRLHGALWDIAAIVFALVAYSKLKVEQARLKQDATNDPDKT